MPPAGWVERRWRFYARLAPPSMRRTPKPRPRVLTSGNVRPLPCGVIAPRGYSRYGVYSNAGFSYKYNWCKGASCQPAQPSCTPAPRQPNANIQKFIQGFTSAYTATRGRYKPAAPTFQPVAPAAPRNPSRAAAGNGASCSSNVWYQSCIRREQLCMDVDPRDWSRIDPTSCCVRNLAQQFNVQCVP
jgi:hypothetical protein